METTDLVQTLFYARGRADTLWNFLLTVHLGLTTGLFLLRTRLTWFIKAVVLVVYLSFMLANHLGFTATHEVMYAAYDALSEVVGSDQNDLLEAMASFDRDRKVAGFGAEQLIPWVHPLMAFFGALLVIFAGPGRGRDGAP